MKKIILVIVFMSSIVFLQACIRGEKMNYREDFILDYYDPFEDDSIITPELSDFFATVTIEDTASYDTVSDGDLWPGAWSNDGYLYVANGDGRGFDMGSHWADIVVNRLSGSPDEGNLRGNRLYPTTGLSQVWGGESYNRKPTSMISVNGDLYMAVQDLNKVPGPNIFNDAPNATIIKSTDKGLTWTWDQSKPMFSGHQFTTVMFLDYGKDSQDNIFDEYVYAYGLDYNWRDSFSGSVPDPQNMFLARMPKNGIQDLTKWQFYAGDLSGNAEWSYDFDERKPVLTDQRRVYTNRINGKHDNFSVLSQGSIVYNKPLNRYIYSSWTEFTFEFYEAPTPHGPWKHFFTKDFGAYPWGTIKYGGYATVIPSKFISNDGLTMYVSSNTFVSNVNKYQYSLRKLVVSLPEESTPSNPKAEVNLANRSYTKNPTAISIATNLGLGNKLNDGRKDVWDDSYNKLAKRVDYWGYTFTRYYNFNELIYTVGKVDSQGGWFINFKVQVRQNGQWVDVEKLIISDNYTFNDQLPSFSEISIKFKDTYGSGIRIIGIPGGIRYSTSIAELEVYYR